MKPKTKKEVGSCVEIKIRAPHAIDATLKNLTHWLISTQVEKLKKVQKEGGAATKRKWEKATTKQKRDYADKQSELQGDNGLSPSQHTQFVKLVKVNSRRDFS